MGASGKSPLKDPKPEQQPKGQRHQSKKGPDQQGQGVGFIDVLHDLIGIDQIIHCYKIVPSMELIPKGKFPQKRKI